MDNCASEMVQSFLLLPLSLQLYSDMTWYLQEMMPFMLYMFEWNLKRQATTDQGDQSESLKIIV